MQGRSIIALMFALLILFAPAAQAQDASAQGDATRAAVLSRSCNSCHGPQGYSPGAIPPINGLAVNTFVRAMREFKSGERASTIMNRLAKGYTDEEFIAMAEYFNRL